MGERKEKALAPVSCKSSATVPRTASHSTSHGRNGLLFPQCARCRMAWMDPDPDRAGQSPPMTVCVWRSATTVDRCHCMDGTGRKAGEDRPVRKQILCNNCRRTAPLSRGPSDHPGHTAVVESLCSYCRGDSSLPRTG